MYHWYISIQNRTSTKYVGNALITHLCVLITFLRYDQWTDCIPYHPQLELRYLCENNSVGLNDRGHYELVPERQLEGGGEGAGESCDRGRHPRLRHHPLQDHGARPLQAHLSSIRIHPHD